MNEDKEPRKGIEVTILNIAQSLANIEKYLAANSSDNAVKNKIWQNPKYISLVLAFVLLFVIDFPTESKFKADLVVKEGAEVSLLKLATPDWKILKLPPNPKWSEIPDKIGVNIGIYPLLEVQLYHQGLRYQHRALRVFREDKSLKVDFSSKIKIIGPTKLILSPVSELNKEERIMLSAITRGYALKVGDKKVPLLKFLITPKFSGHLVIETKPEIGLPRFKRNFEKAFEMFF